MPASSIRGVMRGWVAILLRAPLALGGRGRRAWLVDAGKRVGRANGSIREGVWYL